MDGGELLPWTFFRSIHAFPCWVKKTGSSLFEVGEVKQEVKNMELKNSGKGGCRTTD